MERTVMKYLVFLFSALFASSVFSAELRPKSVKELKDSSVRIYNLEMNSGGTGSIYRSYKQASHILTNKHVCRLIEQGGYVESKGKKYLITHYKKFKKHDLCLVRVEKNFKINLKIADTLAKESQIVRVSGHPNLLPHIATSGHLSGRIEVQLMVGVKECTEKDLETHAAECLFLGGVPIVEEFDSQVVSNLIKPGSSGSAVFNKKGEIVGVVYAGTGRGFSHGFIVPQIYLFYFLQNAHRQAWIKTGTPVDDEGIKRRIFSFQECQANSSIFNTKACQQPHIMIWRKND